MILDLKNPTLVIVGTWNAPIFTPPWLAQHLFDYPAGQESPLIQLLGAAPNEAPRQVLYFRNLGIHVEWGRVDLFANRGTNDFSRVETLAKQLLNKLPHTPIGALGVNFHFVEDNPSHELVHKLDTSELLPQHYQVIRSQTSTWIASNPFVCRVQRDLTESGALVIDFNYHWEGFGEQADRTAALDGVISTRLAHAVQFLTTIYDLEDYEAVGHDFTPEMGADWGD